MCLCFHWQRLSPHPCLKNPWVNINPGKSTLFPQQKGKQSFPPLSLFVTPFWVIEILIHQLCSACKNLSDSKRPKRCYNKITDPLNLVAKIQVSFRCFQYEILSLLLKCSTFVKVVHAYWLNIIQCMNRSLYFVRMVFKAWHRSQMNNLAGLWSRLLETNTILPLSPRLSVWKWLPCSSREVRRWACCTHNPSAFTQNFIGTPQSTLRGVSWMTAGIEEKH